MRRRAVVGAVATIAVTLIFPAVGEAATAHLDRVQFPDEGGNHVDWFIPRYEAAPGETNTVTISRFSDGRGWIFTDATAPLVAGEYCTSTSAHRVTCRAPNNRLLAEGTANLLDGDDQTVVSVDNWYFTVRGGEGDDELNGSGDNLIGGPGADTLTGGGGDDPHLDGGPGPDTIDGGLGQDQMVYRDRTAGEDVSVTLDGVRNDGADPSGDGVSSATEEGDRDISIEGIIGGDGDDRLIGSDSSRDHLFGGDGNDFLDGGLRGDRIRGHDGGDTVSYASRGSGAPVAVTLGPGQPAANDGADPNRDGTSAGSEEGDDVEEVEHVRGGAGPDILVGNGVANSLRGGAGDDRLDGLGNGDLLDGGIGSDTMSYASRDAGDGGVAVTLDGLRNDGADPDGSGLSTAGEENDRDVSIENAAGGGGPDMLKALGDVVNRLFGNDGDDKLFARDGGTARDQLNCGTGADARHADPGDAIGSCETRIP